MPNDELPLDALAQIAGIEIEPHQREQVAMFLRTASKMAAIIEAVATEDQSLACTYSPRAVDRHPGQS